MAEYIDKHEAYLLLKDLEAAYIYPPVREAYGKAARRIDQMKAAEVQPVDRWISVDIKLPEDNGMVLCYCRTTTGEGDLYMLGSCQKGSWFLKTSRIHCTFPNPQMQVLYWQPLPAPPKEG